MFRTMIKHMAPNDPQRQKLIEADELASKIALAETDEQTKRAATMYCLSSTVDDIPPNLFSHSRKYIDCIDVEDTLAPSPEAYLSSSSSSTPGSSSTGSALHCTLFLFDDRLVIVKRPGDKSGRALTGIDDLDKVVVGRTLSIHSKRNGLAFKGMVELVDVAATDIGGPGKQPSSPRIAQLCSVRETRSNCTNVTFAQISTSTSKRHHRIRTISGMNGHSARCQSCFHHHQSTSTPHAAKTRRNDFWRIYGRRKRGTGRGLGNPSS